MKSGCQLATTERVTCIITIETVMCIVTMKITIKIVTHKLAVKTVTCISAADTSNYIIATKRATNIFVTESATCIIAVEPQDLHNCNRCCHRSVSCMVPTETATCSMDCRSFHSQKWCHSLHKHFDGKQYY